MGQATAAAITLPHTGLRVPHTRFSVTGYKELNTHDGVAFTANLRRDNKTVGLIEQGGHGGPTMWQPTDSTRFGWRDMEAFAADCRTADDEQADVERVLDELVEEHQAARALARTLRAGQTPVRVNVAYYNGDEPIGAYAAEYLGLTGGEVKPDRYPAVAQMLATRRPVGKHDYWQIWTGSQWVRLPSPAATQ